MGAKIGYKQLKEHFNEVPCIVNKITNLSGICKSYYNPNADKTADKEVVLSRPQKYYFDITIQQPGLSSAFKHSCYFDDKNNADEAYQEIKLKLFDQKTKKFMRKLNSGKRLSLGEKVEFINIFEGLK